MREPVTPDADDGRGYGRGLWLDGPFVSLSGMDHGASRAEPARSEHRLTATSLANAEVPILGRTRSVMAAALEAVGGPA